MARAQGARAKLAAAFESVYGTAPTSGYYQMPFASSALGQQQPLINSELLGYGRDPVAPLRDVVTADGDVIVPIDAEAFGVWLKAAFGTPTTTEVTGVFTHVFKSGSWSLPSLSIETAMPEVPHYAMVSGAMVNQLSWTMGRSGLLTATVGMIAQGEAIASTSGAGTPTAFELIRFGHFAGSIKRDGVALANVVSAELTYANNLDPVEVIRADGKISGADPSLAAMTGRMTVRFDSQALLTQAVSGAPCALEFAYVLGSGESLTVALPKVYLPRPKTEVSGPAGVQVTFDWQAAQADAGAAMVVVTLVNAVESY